MSNTPAITITRLDLQRLERLLDSLEDFGPTAEALERSWRVPRWWATTKCRPGW